MVVFENRNLSYVVVPQPALMCRQCLIGGVLFEILGFVGSYDLERFALLLLICFYSFVVLKIKGDYYVGRVTAVVLYVLDLCCLLKYRMYLVL